jgi:hypothetical protein
MVAETIAPPRTEKVAAWLHIAILLILNKQEASIVNTA